MGSDIEINHSRAKREFNQQYYDESKHAEKRVVSALKNYFEIEERGDTFEEDIRIIKDKKVIATGDMEVRFKWKEKYFPYYSIHIPMRKKKFMEKDIPFFYFVVNCDGTECLITDKKSILDSKIIPLKLTYPDREVEEEFYDVPLHKWKQGYGQLAGYITKKIEEYNNPIKKSKTSDANLLNFIR